MAAMLTLARVFWQQPCEAGIRICPHSFFMMWQQARSAALICASGAMQATTGDRQMMFNSNSAPRLDKNFTMQDTPSKTGLPRNFRDRCERECCQRCAINHRQALPPGHGADVQSAIESEIAQARHRGRGILATCKSLTAYEGKPIFVET